MRAWSSAVRTRIGPGPAPILGLLPIRLLNLLSQEPESATSLPAAISNSRRNTQLDLRSDSLLAPDFQPPAKSLGTFAHTRQAPMTSTGALIGNFRSDSDSVVSHVKLELRISVSDFRFNLLRPCVAKSVSQRLAPNPVDFIAQHGIQFSLFPFHQQAHAGDAAGVVLSGKSFAQSGKCRCDSFVSALQCNVERLHSFARSPRKKVAHSLQAKHQPLKTLQQRVMEFPGDACSLAKALIQAHIELEQQLI